MTEIPNRTVGAEEHVFSGRYSNNDAGPMWCYNNACIVRVGEKVFVSATERLPGVAPLNDCRWALMRRTPAGWQREQADEEGRRRWTVSDPIRAHG